jgi:hypothetical protein
MEYSPSWEAKSRSVGQENLRSLQIQKFANVFTKGCSHCSLFWTKLIHVGYEVNTAVAVKRSIFWEYNAV